MAGSGGSLKIYDIFSSQQKSSPSISSQYSPSNKRKRNGEAHPISPAKPISTVNMYNFSTPRQASNGVVDLISPNGTPQKNKQRRLSVSAKVENAPSPHGPKKLVVKNLRPLAKSDSSQYAAKAIQQLEDALASIFAHKRPQQSNEELYKGCENLCKLGKAPELSRLLKDRCKTYITRTVKSDLQLVSDGKDHQVLSATLAAWSTWSKQVHTIRGIFFYLDRSHLLQTQSGGILEFTVGLFRTHIFGDAAVQGKVMNATGDLLLADRQGVTTGVDDFAAAVKMFHDLGVYTSDLEPHLLAQSQTFVSKWSDEKIASLALPEYVSAAVALMTAEMQRCEDFDLDRSTRNSLLTLLEDHLIQRRQNDLCELACATRIYSKLANL